MKACTVRVSGSSLRISAFFGCDFLNGYALEYAGRELDELRWRWANQIGGISVECGLGFGVLGLCQRMR